MSANQQCRYQYEHTVYLVCHDMNVWVLGLECHRRSTFTQVYQCKNETGFRSVSPEHTPVSFSCLLFETSLFDDTKPHDLEHQPGDPSTAELPSKRDWRTEIAAWSPQCSTAPWHNEVKKSAQKKETSTIHQAQLRSPWQNRTRPALQQFKTKFTNLASAVTSEIGVLDGEAHILTRGHHSTVNNLAPTTTEIAVVNIDS